MFWYFLLAFALINFLVEVLAYFELFSFESYSLFQNEKDCPVNEASTHITNIGRLVEVSLAWFTLPDAHCYRFPWATSSGVVSRSGVHIDSLAAATRTVEMLSLYALLWSRDTVFLPTLVVRQATWTSNRKQNFLCSFMWFLPSILRKSVLSLSTENVKEVFMNLHVVCE